MNTAIYAIDGGNYEQGGLASKQLKEMLKKIGVDASAVRKTMIAAYEAEMNVVIHARKGVMKVAVDPSHVDVAVIDEGPGIPDIDRAMTEGFSTAPPVARELGFGAGMGLPNIKRNSDRFSLQSTVNQGTHLRFAIYFAPQRTEASVPNAVHILNEKCRQCLMCLHACPTQAMRMRDAQPRILDHLCIDCTSCIAVCEAGALVLNCPPPLASPEVATVLVVPASFFEQFGAGPGPSEIVAALHGMGFASVRSSAEWECALRNAVDEYAQRGAVARPVLSPVCPAIVNLIQLKFPSLIAHVAPFLTPIEAAREELRATSAAFVPACPSQQTALRAIGTASQREIVDPHTLRSLVAPRVAGTKRALADAPQGASAPAFEVSGVRHVLKVLDAIENGEMDDCDVIELFACDQGCFGSPIWKEAPFVARRRFERTGGGVGANDAALALPREKTLQPRPGLRLDRDMARAIEKLAQIDELARTLPGRNCCVCGAPTCAALAEDVVAGRATVDACAYRQA
ncbi:MAG TPA: (Fe-S)-binding protein [Candidatus Hydrogenedentes bacterium]|nr:(Fe-S)-binding protein [Candidatus Hydrogenedentota bacterium]HOS03254.1 (Fe-S)-binding protein [Candidatus Hydrogenedentota bacterium]